MRSNRTDYEDTDEEFSDSESEEEEEEEEEESKEADEVGNEYDLLALAKRRMAAIAPVSPDEQEEDSSSEEEDSSDSEEESDEDGNEPHVSQANYLQEAVDNKTSSGFSPSNAGPLQYSFLEEAMKKKSSPLPKIWTGRRSSKPHLPGEEGMKTSPQGPSSTRRKRQENAELWALLSQTQSRLEATKDLVEAIEKEDREKDVDGGDDEVENTSDEGEPTSSKTKTEPHEDEKKQEEEEIQKRDFQQENRELWDLLIESKRRLEEAEKARQEAEEEKRRPKEKKSQKEENPYAKIDTIPDEPFSDKLDEAALTQKDLLLAMAVAEEAARSGRDSFLTPDREILRERDMDSFAFLKEDREKEQQAKLAMTTNEDAEAEAAKQQSSRKLLAQHRAYLRESFTELLSGVPRLPIRNEKEEQQERNRLRALTGTLAGRWKAFRMQSEQVDGSSKQI